MAVFNVVEKFISINGEGRKAGQLAVFIRFKGCNLNCSYCDTKWSNQHDAESTQMTEQEIYDYIKACKVENVTLTGGEPLIQKDIKFLLEKLSLDDSLNIEIETNGAADISCVNSISGKRPSVTLDYKLPSSGMEEHMNMDNYSHLTSIDTVKFVSGSLDDLEKAKEIINTYSLAGKCAVYISPVFRNIETAEIVEFMIENNMNKVNLQIQLHKVIWDPQKRGV